jgi:uncharacterized protein (TIGR03000 family)
MRSQRIFAWGIPALAAAAVLLIAEPSEAGAMAAPHGGGSHGGGYHGGGYHGGGYHGGGYHGGGYHGGGYHGGYHGGYNSGYHSYYHPGFYGSYYRGYYPGYYGSYYRRYYPGYGYGYPYSSSYYGYDPSYYNSYSTYAPPATGYQSFYPPTTEAAPSAPTGNTALINVWVPAGAEMWFGETRTNLTGSYRQFISPPLTPGKNYTYEVRARWTQNGQVVDRTQTVAVQAGAKVDVDFTRPTPAS